MKDVLIGRVVWMQRLGRRDLLCQRFTPCRSLCLKEQIRTLVHQQTPFASLLMRNGLADVRSVTSRESTHPGKARIPRSFCSPLLVLDSIMQYYASPSTGVNLTHRTALYSKLPSSVTISAICTTLSLPPSLRYDFSICTSLSVCLSVSLCEG